ncbi:DUF4407 domain-containing protein [Catellatospora vulcania]|uniref:DUF4407 domain-containing protein n=1 Tax=Catellatospora vulcania TaxID=1460450 RepID=UPI0018AF868A|nr:DUF4407 domain-containing protein [Catellatospora vulcania]
MSPTKIVSQNRRYADADQAPRPVRPWPGPEARRRPEPVDLSTVGRWLRYLAGVNEKLLDQVHYERTWYAALGGVILGTATIAAFSMWFAVNQAVGIAHLGIVVPVLIWFLFILNLDRWLVASRPTRGWPKFWLVATRVVLAVLFGVVIAEPLVMRIFETKIIENVRADRADHLATFEGRLTACNPDLTVPGATVPNDCSAKEKMSLGDPRKQSDELTALREDAAGLQKSIDDFNAKHQQRQVKANAECVGTSGPGLTGRRGEGPRCERLTQEADDFAAQYPLVANTTRLAEMKADIAVMEGDLTDARAALENARTAEIKARLAKEVQVDAPIGLLERMQALHVLGDENSALWWGILMVRLLFIAVDCSPVLLKMANSRTAYDRLVEAELDEAVSTHIGGIEKSRRGREVEDQLDREEHTLAEREREADLSIRYADAVDNLAKAYEKRARAEAAS